jgi:hypothetical protein
MPKQRRYLDLVLTAVGLLLAVVLQAINDAEVLRPFVGLLFLACTGYIIYAALTLALSDHFGLAARVAITIVAYVSTSVSIGTLLNLSRWGLTRQTWLMSLTILASVLLIVTALSRTAADHHVYARWNLTRSQTAKLGLAGGLFAAAFAVAYAGSVAQPTTGFTQLWMVQTGDTTDVSLRMGIYNVENESQTYSLQVLSNRNVIEEWQDIRLSPDTKWETTWALPEAGIVYPLVGELYISGQEKVYRRTQFWLVEPSPISIDNG